MSASLGWWVERMFRSNCQFGLINRRFESRVGPAQPQYSHPIGRRCVHHVTSGNRILSPSLYNGGRWLQVQLKAPDSDLSRDSGRCQET